MAPQASAAAAVPTALISTYWTLFLACITHIMWTGSWSPQSLYSFSEGAQNRVSIPSTEFGCFTETYETRSVITPNCYALEVQVQMRGRPDTPTHSE